MTSPSSFENFWVKTATAPCSDGDRMVPFFFAPGEVELLVDNYYPGSPPPSPEEDKSVLSEKTGWQRFMHIHLDSDYFNGTDSFLCVADEGDQANTFLANEVDQTCLPLFQSRQNPQPEELDRKRCEAIAEAYRRRSSDTSFGSKLWHNTLKPFLLGFGVSFGLFGPPYAIFKWLWAGIGKPGNENVLLRGLCASAGEIGGGTTGVVAPISAETASIQDMGTNPRDGKTCLVKDAREIYVIAQDENGDEIFFDNSDLTKMRDAFFRGAGSFGIHSSEVWSPDGGRICVRSKGAEENALLLQIISATCLNALKESPNAEEKCDALEGAIASLTPQSNPFFSALPTLLGTGVYFWTLNMWFPSIEKWLARRLCYKPENNAPPVPEPAPEPETDAPNLYNNSPLTTLDLSKLGQPPKNKPLEPVWWVEPIIATAIVSSGGLAVTGGLATAAKNSFDAVSWLLNGAIRTALPAL